MLKYVFLLVMFVGSASAALSSPAGFSASATMSSPAGFSASAALTHGNHTDDFCSPRTSGYCAHLGYDSAPEIGKSFDFVVDFIDAKFAAELTGVQVEVAVDAGNQQVKIIPTTVKKMDLKHYQVETAEPISSRVLLVKVTASFQNLQETLFIFLDDTLE